MPGSIGFAAYGPALAMLPATSAEIGAKVGFTSKGVGELMRRFWALGLVHPGGVEGNPAHIRGGRSKTVWHLGKGPAVSLRVSPIQPRASHILLATIVRALEQPMTTKELAEEVGISQEYAGQRIKMLRDAKMLHISEWGRDACGRAVPRYEWGRGVDAKKPAPQANVEKWRRYKSKRKSLTLENVWRIAA